MQNDFNCVEQSAVETVTKLAKAESLRYFTKLIISFITCSTVLLLYAFLTLSSTERFRFMEEEC